jgi:hypothetical protein
LQHWPVADVARTLRISAPQVYLAKHRVGALLKRELKKIERRLNAPELSVNPVELTAPDSALS